MKKVFLAIALCCSLTAYSQTNKNLQLGLSTATILSPIDNNMSGALNLSLGLDFSENFAAGFDLNTGLSFGIYDSENRTIYQQGSLNGVAKFFNSQMKVGVGISLMQTWDKRVEEFLVDINIVNRPTNYSHSTRFLVGGNFVVEYFVPMKNDYIFVLKAYRQSYYTNVNITGIGCGISKVF